MYARLIILTVILLATVGAGTVDVLCPDVIPLRPYTNVFQTAHLLVSTDKIQLVQIPVMLVLAVVATLIMVAAIVMFPHLPLSLSLMPLGSRGSHSRANRRASGAGWKDTSQKQPLTADEQFRILMQIFGKPRMVILYGKDQQDKKK